VSEEQASEVVRRKNNMPNRILKKGFFICTASNSAAYEINIKNQYLIRQMCCFRLE
jgi:hypothetical protein